MKVTTNSTIMLLSILPFAFAQTPDTLWTKTYGGISGDVGNAVQQTTDGGYIIAGSTRSFGNGGWDVFVIKTDSLGNLIWTKTYGGTNDDGANSVQQIIDGGYIIVGYTDSFTPGYDIDIYLIKTDKNGDTVWTKTYGGSQYTYGQSKQDVGELVYEIVDSGYVVTAFTTSFKAGHHGTCLIRTNLDGDTLWTKAVGEDSAYLYSPTTTTSDGGYIEVWGTESSGADDSDVLLRKRDKNFDIVWEGLYGGAGDDIGKSVQRTTDGGYIITGWTDSFHTGDFDVYLIKTKPDVSIK